MMSWFKVPTINLWPYFEYRTFSQFLKGNWIFADLSPYEQIIYNFKPYLNPTATFMVKGWVSKLVGNSVLLKLYSQESILSKLVEDRCWYFIALIFF